MASLSCDSIAGSPSHGVIGKLVGTAHATAPSISITTDMRRRASAAAGLFCRERAQLATFDNLETRGCGRRQGRWLTGLLGRCGCHGCRGRLLLGLLVTSALCSGRRNGCLPLNLTLSF
jgi:hypothetical protein